MPPNLEQLRAKFRDKDYLLTAHASDRAAQRGILSLEIEQVVIDGAIIEDYPEDKYGPSCLIMGTTTAGKILHVQVSYPPNIKVITIYVPSPDEWEEDFKTRKAK